MSNINLFIDKIEQIRQGRAEIIVNLNKLEQLPPSGDGNSCIEPIEWENPYLPCVMGAPIWERFDWESTEQYNMFNYFKGLGVDRTIFLTAKKYGKQPLDIVRLSKMFHWKERANAYDYYETSIHDYRIREKQRQIAESHFNTAQALFNKCADYCAENLQHFAPKEVIKLMEMSASLGRQAVGQESPRGGGSGNGTVVNINQNLAPGASPLTPVMEAPKDEEKEVQLIEDVDQEKTRLAGIINIMNEIGALNPQESEVEELNTDEIIMRE